MSAQPAPGALAAWLMRRYYTAEQGELSIGGVRVSTLADAYGTPLYVFDAALMRRRYRELSAAVQGFAEVYYSVKANPNVEVARIFVDEGAGLEVASGREFLTARAAGCSAERILFAGPAKGEAELALVVEQGIGEIHLESYEEIALVGAIARQRGVRVKASVRVNPIAAAQGGAMRMGGKPAAFGFDEEDLAHVVDAIGQEPGIELIGVHLFAGTQILDANVLLTQWAHGLDVAARLSEMIGAPLHTIDLGGGLGIPYHDGDASLDLSAVAAGAPALIHAKSAHAGIRDARVILEPGRFLVGESGLYLMRVRSVKRSRGQRFVLADGGMHHHLAASGNLGQVVKRDYPIVATARLSDAPEDAATLVGPLCTPLDTLGRKALLPAMQAGDLVAVLQSGAYGLTASPHGFLGHPTPAEVLVDGAAHRLIRAAGRMDLSTVG
ncbi:MAG: type III PLP-dependent enzyme [Hyphomonadaceae bacterium]